jgi:hypothetical protein
LAVVGALLILVSGIAGVLRGGRWPVMSGRYERGPDASIPIGPAEEEHQGQPGTSPVSTEGDRSAPHHRDRPPQGSTDQRQMWDALDRGEDPTD